MTGPLISCIVPVFNGEAFLAEAVDSIVSQNYRPIEIIVVDDGSTDRTAAIVDGYGKQVRYIWQENRGPAAARNRGILASKGGMVGFLDSDDLWVDGKLKHQLSVLVERPELDYVVCHVQNFWVDELSEERAAYRDHPRSSPIPGYTTVGLLAHREAFDRVGLFNPRLSHSDSTDWFLRAKSQGLQGELLEDVLVQRRIHPDSRSRRRSAESSDEFLRLLKGRVISQGPGGNIPDGGDG